MQPLRFSVVGPAIIQLLRFVALAIFIPSMLFSLACGHSGSTTTTTVGVAPTFTSTAPPISQQGILYTYTPTAVTTDSSTVTFALTTGPTGATMTNNELMWTPTAAESRISNSFTITATTSNNGTNTQTFTVTPTGYISGTAIDQAITGTGLVNYPQDLGSAVVEVLFSNGTGGYNSLRGAGDSAGNFNIPNVPAGSFWLHLPHYSNGVAADNYIWTNSSTIDAGQLLIGRPDAVPAPAGVTIQVSDVTLKVPPTSTDSIRWVSPDAKASGAPAGVPTTPLNASFTQTGHLLNSSKGDRGFLLHYTTSGLITREVESETFDSISQTNGGTTTLTGSMSANTGSTTDPDIMISQFDSILDNVGGTTGPIQRSFTLFDAGYPGTEGWLPSSIYAPEGSTPIQLISAALTDTTTDTDLGSIPYGIVSSNGVAYMQYVNLGSRVYTIGGSTYTFQDVGSIIVSNAVPTSGSPIVPLLFEPETPSINGLAFLSNQNNIPLTPQLSWAAPTGGTATAYELTIVNPASLGTATPDVHYFYTSTTGLAIPAGVLQPSTSYVFILQAITYENPSFATAPFRMGTGNYWTGEVSGIMTTVSGAGTSTKRSKVSTTPKSFRIVPTSNGRITTFEEKK
jgi:hypothetical protein